MRNVTIVVPVFITSCHVSEKPKKGPDSAQARTVITQTMKASGLPVACAIAVASSVLVFAGANN